MEQDREPTPRDDRQLVLQLANQLLAAVQRLTGATGPAPPEATAPAEPPLKVPDRWREMLRLMRDGFAYKEIADIMRCRPSTLRTYRERIAKKYGIKGKAALVGWAVGKGLV